MDLPGWDYFSVPNVTEWIDCQRSCNNDRICQSWTFVSNRPLNNNCFLKSGIPFLVGSTVCTSGVKPRSNSIVQQPLWIFVNRSLSSKNPHADRGIAHSPIWMQSSSSERVQRWFLDLQIYVDHSVIEIFDPREGRIALTTRVYPDNTIEGDRLGLYLRVKPNDDEVILNSLDLWSMESI